MPQLEQLIHKLEVLAQLQITPEMIISGLPALATAPADTDEFMDDGGVLKRIDASLVVGGGKVLQVVQNWDDQYATYSNTSRECTSHSFESSYNTKCKSTMSQSLNTSYFMC